MRISHFVSAVLVALMACWSLSVAETAQELNDKGEAAYKAKDYAKALEYYTEVLKIEPDRHASRYARGVNYYELKKYSAAKADFDSLLKIPNIDHHAFNYLGLIYTKSNEHKEALAAFKQASDLRPKNLLYCLNKARAAAASGDRLLAIRSYKQALAIDSHNEEAKNYINDRKAALKKDEVELQQKREQEEAAWEARYETAKENCEKPGTCQNCKERCVRLKAGKKQIECVSRCMQEEDRRVNEGH